MERARVCLALRTRPDPGQRLTLGSVRQGVRWASTQGQGLASVRGWIWDTKWMEGNWREPQARPESWGQAQLLGAQQELHNGSEGGGGREKERGKKGRMGGKMDEREERKWRWRQKKKKEEGEKAVGRQVELESSLWKPLAVLRREAQGTAWEGLHWRKIKGIEINGRR